MKINLNRFLKLTALSLTHEEKCVNGISGTKKYSCSCPFHSDPNGSLKIIENELTGELSFRCIHKSCKFKGDAILFYAIRKGKPIKDAVLDFRPGGCMSECLDSPLKESEVVAYLDCNKTQNEISSYLVRCHQELVRSPERWNLRPGLSQTSLRMVPDDVGIMIKDESMPIEFQEFRKTKYKNATLILYPFFYQGRITHIDVYDAYSPTFKYTVTITRPDTGIFLEEFEQYPRKLAVCPDPIAASIFYGNAKAVMSEKPPIVAVSGFPLSEFFSGTDLLCLVSSKDHPVSLDYSLSVLETQDLVSGTINQPKTIIWNSGKACIDLNGDDLQHCFSMQGTKCCSITKWIAYTLIRLYRSGNLEEITSTIGKRTLQNSIKELILEEIRIQEGPEEIVNLLQNTRKTLSESLTLGNGYTLRCDPTELSVVGNKGRVNILCNFGLRVHHKIKSYDSSEILVCTVTPSDKELSPIKVNLPEQVWNSAYKIRNLICKAFSARSQTPYVAVYESRYCSWSDVLGKLAENCVLHQEVKALGIDELSDIHFPNVVIRNNGKIEEEKQIFTISEQVTRSYAGILPEETLCCTDPIRNLIMKCNNLYVAAFTCGLMHVLYQITYGRHKTELLKKSCNRHLFFVETESNIWKYVFRQLANLFSGEDYVPCLNYADPETTLSEFEPLGTLPLICEVPSIGGRLAKALDGSSTDLIGIVDTSTATLINGKISGTYLVPFSEDDVKNNYISPVYIDAVRNAFPSFVQWYISNVDMKRAYRSANPPCVMALHECCRLLSIDPVYMQIPERIAKGYFQGTGLTGVQTFFDMIHRGILTDNPRGICVLYEKPQKGFSFTRRGQHVFVMENEVIIGHNIVEFINRDSVCKFSIEQLTEELSERELSISVPLDLELDQKRCWCIRRSTWEKEIVRPPISLNETISSGTIELSELQ